MTFYQESLGGELNLQEVGDSPLAKTLPPNMKNCILHARLSKQNFTLMATDMVEDEGFNLGNSMAILLECETEEDLRKYFLNLANGGKVTHAPKHTFRGALFGTVTDKFGVRWMVHFLAEEAEFSSYRKAM